MTEMAHAGMTEMAHAGMTEVAHAGMTKRVACGDDREGGMPGGLYAGMTRKGQSKMYIPRLWPTYRWLRYLR